MGNSFKADIFTPYYRLIFILLCGSSKKYKINRVYSRKINTNKDKTLCEMSKAMLIHILILIHCRFFKGCEK